MKLATSKGLYVSNSCISNYFVSCFRFIASKCPNWSCILGGFPVVIIENHSSKPAYTLLIAVTWPLFDAPPGEWNKISSWCKESHNALAATSSTAIVEPTWKCIWVTDRMNIFRLSGDLCHLLAIIVLLLKIWKTRSCAGKSPAECVA